MKYCIQEFRNPSKNAGSKAVLDAAKILIANGYKAIDIVNRRRYLLNNVVKLLFKLRKNDVVVLQWPFHGLSEFLISSLLLKKIRLTLLLHDLNSLRAEGVNEDIEIKLLSFAEHIIVHTDSMKRFLIQKGVSDSKLSILTTFDYLTNDKFCRRTYSNNVVFAGNLKKSTFLKKIPSDCFGINFNCYGLPSGIIPEYLTYKGSFSPDNVSVIEGSWGLVWDGDSIVTCRGSYGEYLKINSPHKISLYIVAGLPIIIWKDAALAQYIIKNNLGITIDSLEDIPTAISKISNEAYKDMLKALEMEADTLKSGGHLSKHLVN